MRRYIVLLITTLHGGGQLPQYILRTAMKIPFSAMEDAGISDIYDDMWRGWISDKLPLHARGHGIINIEDMFEVVEVPGLPEGTK